MASYLAGIFLRTGERARKVKSPWWKPWEQRDASLNEYILESETEVTKGCEGSGADGRGGWEDLSEERHLSQVGKEVSFFTASHLLVPKHILSLISVLGSETSLCSSFCCLWVSFPSFRWWTSRSCSVFPQREAIGETFLLFLVFGSGCFSLFRIGSASAPPFPFSPGCRVFVRCHGIFSSRSCLGDSV